MLNEDAEIKEKIDENLNTTLVNVKRNARIYSNAEV